MIPSLEEPPDQRHSQDIEEYVDDLSALYGKEAQPRDFDEDADDLWALYGKAAESYDEGP